MSIINENHRSKTHGKKRSPEWGKFKREFAETHPKVCAVCGTTKKVALHHLRPFHLHPELELSENNMLWVCERQGHDHHFFVAHLENFKSYNPNAKEDAETWRQKIQNRP